MNRTGEERGRGAREATQEGAIRRTWPYLPDVHGPFLDALRRQRAQVMIYLINGVRITGQVDSFDEISIVLRSEHAQQSNPPEPASASRKRIIFNHFISTVQPCADARRAAED